MRTIESEYPGKCLQESTYCIGGVGLCRIAQSEFDALIQLVLYSFLVPLIPLRVEPKIFLLLRRVYYPLKPRVSQIGQTAYSQNCGHPSQQSFVQRPL